MAQQSVYTIPLLFFLGLNLICYLVILFCYVVIVQVVKNSTRKSGRTPDIDKEIKMTMKVAAIVATDFFWLVSYYHSWNFSAVRLVVLPPSVYAWLVTCVLPINSAINPYLYTISEVISEYGLSRKKRTKKDLSGT